MVAPSKYCRDGLEAVSVAHLGFPSIGSWKFPRQLSEFYRSVGISALFKWQIECLELPGVLGGKNLLFAAPTSAGKTLVAEILMWKRLTELNRKTIYVVPFVSVGREKMVYLQSLFKSVGLKVDAYIGSQNSIVGIRSWDVAVCTIEKANNLINRCIEENSLDLIGSIVVDEFHIIGDAQRGYLVELLVTKLLQMRQLSGVDIQIVAMSATISNLSSLARWMNAAEYVTDFRPITLSETLFTDGSFFTRNMNNINGLSTDFTIPGDQDNVVGLCLETVTEGYGVLVFCATKQWCEKLSETIAQTFWKILKRSVVAHLSDRLRQVLDQSAISVFMNEYKRIIGIVDPILARTVPYAVGFHHAGLTMEEREQLERGFRTGVIKVLVATSTLSSGVNLPARRVIIRSLWGQAGVTTGPCLTHGAYKQMVGRAGRQGIDSKGESVIICKRQEVKRALDLMNGSIETVESALGGKGPLTDKDGTTGTSIRLKRAVLEAVVGHLAKSRDDVATYVKCTLMMAEMQEMGQGDAAVIQKVMDDCLNYLTSHQFLAMDGDSLVATQLGRATIASAMNPEEAGFMFQDLKQAQQALALDNELHMVYLVTPTYMQDQWGSDFDWFGYHRLWCSLNENQRRISKLIGVSEAFILNSSRKCGPRPSASVEARKYAIHMRFYTAMALFDLIEEIPLSKVAEKFGCSRGFLQALQQQASTYAGMSIAFCDRLGWWYIKTLLTGFAERIAFGVRRELTELVQIDGIDGSRARCFHHSGFTTLASLVQAKTADIAAALRKAVPFKSETEIGHRSLKRCWLSGHPEMTEEDAVALIQIRANRIFEENLRRFGISLDKAESVVPAKESALVDVISKLQQTADSKSGPPSPVSESKADRRRGAEVPVAATEDPTYLTVEDAVIENHAPVTEINATRLDSSKIESGDQPAEATNQEAEPTAPTVKVTNQTTTNDGENVGEIVLNMSRVSITPRSINGDATSATPASENDSVARKIVDLEWTDSQIVKAIDALVSPTPKSGNGDEVRILVNGSDGELAFIKSTDGIFLGQTLPSTLSVGDVDKIRRESNDICAFDSSSIDLFDNNWRPEDSDGSENDASSSPALSGPDSGLGTASSSQLHESTLEQPRMETRTPIQATRKRQRHRYSNSSTPSPLVKKCSRTDTAGTAVKPDMASELPMVRLDSSDQIVIVDVCANIVAFSAFSSAWRSQKRFAIAFASKIRSPKKGEITSEEIIAVAVCWEPGAVHYLSLDDGAVRDSNANQSTLPKNAISRYARLNTLKRCLCAKAAEESEKLIFDYLRAQRLIRSIIPDPITGGVHCLRIADWLLTCGNEDTPFTKSAADLINRYSGSSGRIDKEDDAKRKICVETAGIFSVWTEVERRLKEARLWTSFVEIEMPAVKVASEMEANGIGFDSTMARTLRSKATILSEDLERRAYQLAGRRFSLTAYADLAKVLFVELGLPADGVGMAPLIRKCQPKKRHYSTSKEILEKLRPFHVLPGVILDWRKLHTALTTAISPLLKDSSNPEDGVRRIFGSYDWYTATGRVIMHEPSLQVMPKHFKIDVAKCDAVSVNVRDLITVQKQGYVLLSADYSQLELRILGHLSEDEKLVEILNSDNGDVFRIIASAWLGLSPDKIDNEQRQRAKKLCYGVIYGMGAKTLAEELEVSEETAVGFVDAFKLQFPGVFRWMADVVSLTRENGYVKTLSGRMRYLPAIRFTTRSLLDQRLHAERQAINTSVQGSAADVFKAALRDVSMTLWKRYSAMDSAYRFILQLHDEMILEVQEPLVNQIAELVRRQMVQCYDLRVGLRVRLAVGKTWGDMKSMDL